MKIKLWTAFLLIVLVIALAMVLRYSTAAAMPIDQPDKPIVCKAVSIYTDGTVIERPCSLTAKQAGLRLLYNSVPVYDPILDLEPGECGLDGCRSIMPPPGGFYRP